MPIVVRNGLGVCTSPIWTDAYLQPMAPASLVIGIGNRRRHRMRLLVHRRRGYVSRRLMVHLR